MRLADLVCRACNKTFANFEGCEICKPAKDNLVYPELDERIDAFSLSKQSARIIGQLLDRLEADIDNHNLQTFHPGWAKDVSLLSRALAVLLNEIRKYEQSGALEATKLSFEDKAQLMLQWVESLPPEPRRALLQQTNQLLLEGAIEH